MNIDKTHARIVDNALQYPTEDMFPNVINWTKNDDLMREKGYFPLVPPPSNPDDTPSVYQFRPDSEQRTISVQVWPDDDHKKKPHWEKRVVTVDMSYIEVTEYIPAPVPPTPTPTVYYSKYKLKNACVSRKLWDTVKSMIEQAGKWESFLLIQDIASDNEELLEVMPDIVTYFGQQTVDEVLAESIAD